MEAQASFQGSSLRISQAKTLRGPCECVSRPMPSTPVQELRGEVYAPCAAIAITVAQNLHCIGKCQFGVVAEVSSMPEPGYCDWLCIGDLHIKTGN